MMDRAMLLTLESRLCVDAGGGRGYQLQQLRIRLVIVEGVYLGRR